MHSIGVINGCNLPYDHHFLCEPGHGDTVTAKPRPVPPPVTRSNQTVPFPAVTCPIGHISHAFLACDAKSACFPVSRGAGLRKHLCRAVGLNLPPPLFLCDSEVESVPYSLVCDHRHDCLDSSDENFCHVEPCGGSKAFQCTTSKQVLTLLTTQPNS